MDRSAADRRCQALVPGEVVPEAGKLRMGEIGRAVETVTVLGAQPGADLTRLFDDDAYASVRQWVLVNWRNAASFSRHLAGMAR